MTLSAPNSEVDICNLALIKLKEDLIVQIDPPSSDTEKLCAQLYQQVRRAALRTHTWNFARKRAILTKNTGNPPLFGFASAFDVPPDFVRFISRHNELGHVIRPLDYELEQNQILVHSGSTVNEDTFFLTYIFDTVEVVKFDPLFIEYFATELALKLSPNFSSAAVRVKADLREDLLAIKQEAKAVDGQEKPPTRIERSKFKRARLTSPRVASPFTVFDQP